MKALLALITAALVLAATTSPALASKTQESMFQDDPRLVYGTPETMNATLDTLSAFGVDRIRVSVFWALIAPANDQENKPGFDLTDPAQYPAELWERYDRLIQAALSRGIQVNLNITSPIPRWAATKSPREDLQDTFGPNPEEFGHFVKALGTRYSGTYQGLPRVDYWSIWNEPNQAGWLTPQWGPDPRDSKRFVEAAPSLYRKLVAAAWVALADTGHGTDTILVGETAPQGEKTRQDLSASIDALRFLRRVYCLDDNLNYLRDAEAQVRDCPVNDAQGFVAANPGLFHASGYAHHPYALLTPPGRRSKWPDWVSMSDLPALSDELRRIYARYGQRTQTKRGVPLYLTEYGYQTKPDPFFAPITFARQAAWINQAEYIAYKNPRVRSMSQFLLVDDAPMAGADPKKQPNLYWRTFQSGLQLLNGKKKPSYKAYMTPFHVKKTQLRRGRVTGVFGMLRPAIAGTKQRVTIEWRSKARRRWHKRKSLNVGGPRHFFETRVRVPGTGYLRLRWRNGRKTVTSRAVAVRVVRR